MNTWVGGINVYTILSPQIILLPVIKPLLYQLRISWYYRPFANWITA